MGRGENTSEEIVAQQRGRQIERRPDQHAELSEWEQDALESGFLLIKRTLYEGSGESFEFDRDAAPEWLDVAVCLYRDGMSRSDISRFLSEERNINANPDQVGEVLKVHGKLKLRRPGAEAPNKYWLLRNPNGLDEDDERTIAALAEIWRANPKLSEADVLENIGEERAKTVRQLATHYTSEEPWSKPAATRAMLKWIASHHYWHRDSPEGLDAEKMLMYAWEKAGYTVRPAPTGNAGTDVAVELPGDRGEPILTHYSCKSSKKEGQRQGGSISIQSLVQHGQKKLETPAQCRKALKTALEHLSDYERIVYVQGVDPDNGERAAAYHVNEIPKKDLHDRLKALKPSDFQKALDERDRRGSSRRSVIVKVHGEDGRIAFHLKITKDVVAITAIKPSYYRRALSLFLEPPKRRTEELERTETERQKKARSKRRRATAQKRGP